MNEVIGSAEKEFHQIVRREGIYTTILRTIVYLGDSTSGQVWTRNEITGYRYLSEIVQGKIVYEKCLGNNRGIINHRGRNS